MPLLLLLAAFAVLFFYGVALYNGLVRLRHMVARCWTDIDALLKQRHEELAKLVEACRSYSQFDPSLLGQVMETRAMLSEAARAANVGRIGELESELRSLTAQIFSQATSSGELLADRQLQHRLVRISEQEEAIAAHRERYNEAVSNNNVRIEQLPDLLVAHLCGFRAAQPLQFAEAEKRNLDGHELFTR
ncbi:LemA family protein [Vogesella oryzae]|uniref:LemA family protein n=1 Tax=Vogesella oryzae TaxID=1735285 RepID=UPI001582F9A1|nr:LemA family protein [Vogesella oryzae]